jgi:hypothetical protein
MPILPQSGSAITNGLLTAASDHIYYEEIYLCTLSSAFWKVVLIATSSFQKPFYNSTRSFLIPLDQ